MNERMRRLAMLTGLVVSSEATASPAQPLDCGDWVILDPGINCSTFLPRLTDDGCGGSDGPAHCFVNLWDFGTARVIDVHGNMYSAIRLPQGSPPRTQIVRWDGAQATVVAYVADREEAGGPGCRQCVSGNATPGTQPVFDCGSGPPAFQLPQLVFDAMNGRLLVGVAGYAESSCDPIPGLAGPRVLQFSGFTTALEILDSYVPSAARFSFRVPQRPEGLPAADHFDTYVGEVTRPLDLSRAQPLQCGYPAAPPIPGDQLGYSATGTPAPGHALFYLTTVTNSGQTRAGRSALDGRLRGRDGTLLPACLTETQLSR